MRARVKDAVVVAISVSSFALFNEINDVFENIQGSWENAMNTYLLFLILQVLMKTLEELFRYAFDKTNLHHTTFA